MALQREEEEHSAAIVRHNLRIFDQLLEQEPLSHTELVAELLATLTNLQVYKVFWQSFVVFRLCRRGNVAELLHRQLFLPRRCTAAPFLRALSYLECARLRLASAAIRADIRTKSLSIDLIVVVDDEERVQKAFKLAQTAPFVVS